MRSLETNKVCKNLTIEHNMFICAIDRKEDPERFKVARCMMDPHAAAFLDAKYCNDYETKGGDDNGQRSSSKAKTQAADTPRV